MPGDTGFFQINNVVLNIPPEQIQVDRQSATNRWYTLRTKSSIKSKSGYSVTKITAKASFTTSFGYDGSKEQNGLQQLRDVLAGLRVTPFCYVENKFLRNSMMGGSSTPTMVLVVRQIQVIKSNDSVNKLDVIFHFSWFNYFPYLREWLYKKDFFSSMPTVNPANSTPWMAMFRAEQTSKGGNTYAEVYTLDQSSAQNTWMLYHQYATVKTDKYLELKQDVAALKNLLRDSTKMISGSGSDRGGSINSSTLHQYLTSQRGEGAGNALYENFFGGTTSQVPGKQKWSISELADLVQGKLSPDSNSLYGLVNTDTWKLVINKKAKAIVLGHLPQDGHKDLNVKDEIVLLARERNFTFSAHDLIVTGITISFENVLATIPLAGQPYPTYQHIGSVDGVVSISMMTTSEDGIAALSNFYSVVEDQATKFRQVPQGHRSIQVFDDVVNLCGLEYFIPENLSTYTVPGQPGTYGAVLTLVDNPLDPYTRETISPGQSFHTRADIRKAIADVITRSLSLSRGPVDTSVLGGLGRVISSTDNKSYVFANSTGRNDNRSAAFREICEEYARELSNIYAELQAVFGTTNYLTANPTPALNDFFSLTDEDIPSVERLQNDIFNHIKYYKGKLDILKNPSSPDQARKNAIAKIEQSRTIGVRTLQGVQQINREGGIGERTQESIEEITQEALIDRVTKFKNDHLLEWLSFSVRFLDRILYSGKFQLEEFKEVQKKVQEMMTSSASSNCYPDFPLQTVVDILSSQDEPAYSQVTNELQEAALKGAFGLRNIGISALLQPDFYLYNAQNDDLGSILPAQMIQAAANGIVQSQADSRVQAEKTWLTEDYEFGVIGSELTARIREDALDMNYDQSFWQDSSERQALQGAIRSINSMQNGAFHYDDLQGLAGGLGCSMLTEAEREPIALKNISLHTGPEDEKRIPGSLVLRERSNVALQPIPDHHATVRHFFGSDSISFKSPASFAPAPTWDPTKDPTFAWPMDASGRVITSRFNLNRTSSIALRSKETGKLHTYLNDQAGYKRDLATRKFEQKITPHRGIDISVRGGSLGHEVKAAADGEIIFIRDKPWNEALGETGNPRKSDPRWYAGNMLILKHANGWKTGYSHMLWEGPYSVLAHAYNSGVVKKVRQGQVIGHVGSTGGSTGAHLHFGIQKPNGEFVDPIPLLDGESSKIQGPIVGFNPATESLFTKSVEQLERDLSGGQGYSLMRAYPTFRLYFIESDLGERKRFQFDDFFSYSAVQDIQVIRSRKIAADLAIITLTNISGNLTNKRFKEGVDRDKPLDEAGRRVEEDPFAPNLTNTIEENPIRSLLLKPGVQIQLRLGYNSNPDELETVLNGVITDVQPNESDDLITITCQSFGIETVQNQHGESKSFGGWFSGSGRTGKLLEELMAYPEMVHFGRWEGGRAQNSAYGLLRSEWNAVPSPQDDNIFAPGGRGLWGLFDSTAKYVLYQSTIWDVFQEMTLRHPAYVAYAVPYEGKWGPRMTMFFGVPDQMYFARDPSFKEENATDALTKFVKDSVENLRENALEDIMDPNKTVFERLDRAAVSLGLADSPQQKARLFWLQKQVKQYALDQGYVKPFRNYHVFTSTQHIIANTITSSSNVFNTVTLQYGDDPAEVENGELTFGDLETLTIRCDASVGDEEVKEMFAQYPNCQGYEMAKRYCVALLLYSLKENYTGSLVVIGSPKVKPHDIGYIFDEYSDMYGPIEVEQVVHRFSQQHGFITEITPDMVVHVNQESTLSTSDAMGLMAESALRRIGLRSLPSVQTATTPEQATGDKADSSIVGTVVGAVYSFGDWAFSPIANQFFNSSEHALGLDTDNNPFGMIGAFIFRKLITRSQLAHPFRYSPLVKNGRPMVGGLPIKKNKGSFIASVKRFARETDEGAALLWADIADSLDPANWYGVTQGSILDTLRGR